MQLANFIVYQCVWFAAVSGAAHGHPWWGPLLALGSLGWHLYGRPQPGREVCFVLGVAVIGCLFDQVMLSSGWIHYEAALPPGIVPPWLAALWVAFATTLNGSLRWLQGRWWMAALLGLLGGPLAYGAAVRMGAMQWGAPHQALLALALGWMFLMPALSALAARFTVFQEARHV